MSMTLVIRASPPKVDWHGINWAKCHRKVRNLQARIVKATRESRYGKVKALQWLLTHSFAAKALAVKRVTANQGKNTPGVDGTTWSTPEAKSEAISTLKRSGYKPQPLKRVYIPKSNGKKRPLGIPTIKDRAMQALHLTALQPIAEIQADKNSYGFRPERACADAIEQCFIILAKKPSAQWVLEGDIKGCFDNIGHDRLIADTPMDKRILLKWLKCGYLEKKKLFPTEAGTPQGGVISPTLANVALDGLEDKLITFKGHHKVHMVRYADDFVITGTSKELLENEVKPLVKDFLASKGLELSEEKTRITHIEEGFDFLGQNVRKYNGKLIIKPSAKNVKNFLTKTREIIFSNKTAKQGNLIQQLNPVIRGWANYHQAVCSKETYVIVDSLIWNWLWQWAKRRHPNKSTHWIKDRYFRRTKTRKWVFGTEVVGSKGDKKWVELWRTSTTPIRRHKKIKADANPFDSNWETYFEERSGWKMARNLRKSKKLKYIWEIQGRKCPICKQPFTENEWHLHYRTPRHLGGSENYENLVLLHPNCHGLVHAKGIEV